MNELETGDLVFFLFKLFFLLQLKLLLSLQH